MFLVHVTHLDDSFHCPLLYLTPALYQTLILNIANLTLLWKNGHKVSHPIFSRPINPYTNARKVFNKTFQTKVVSVGLVQIRMDIGCAYRVFNCAVIQNISVIDPTEIILL